MYIKCWFYIIKYIFCIKNDVSTIECAFNLGQNKTYALPSVGYFLELCECLPLPPQCTATYVVKNITLKQKGKIQTQDLKKKLSVFQIKPSNMNNEKPV
jgi:hypothetical protein